MELYLSIITTALVLTQIVRLAQNAMQLKHMKGLNRRNEYILKVYQKIEHYIDSKGI